MKLYIFRTVPLSIIGSLFTENVLLLESCLQTCVTYTIAECTVNKLPMMDTGTVPNMYSFMPE